MVTEKVTSIQNSLLIGCVLVPTNRGRVDSASRREMQLEVVARMSDQPSLVSEVTQGLGSNDYYSVDLSIHSPCF